MIVKYDTAFLTRIIIFTIAYSMIEVIIPQQPELTITYLLGASITGFLYAWLLGYTLTKMSLSRKAALLAVFIPIYVIQGVNPMLEGFFFSFGEIDWTLTLLMGGLVFRAMQALMYSLIAVLLFKTRVSNSLMERLRDYFSRLRLYEWAWRITLSALSWPLFYFVFGLLVESLVTPIYIDLGWYPFPPIENIIALQIFRGFLYILVLLPIIASLKTEIKWSFLVIAGFMFIGGSLATFIIVETFPVVLRVVHGFGDILFPSLLFGMVTVFLLKRI